MKNFLNLAKVRKILNFGAGHGGISFFLHAQNHEIYNYEPGGLKTFFNERWTNIKNLQETNLKFDLIYASHSLEHVHNINSTLKTFNDISNNDTIFFSRFLIVFQNNRSKFNLLIPIILKEIFSSIILKFKFL